MREGLTSKSTDKFFKFARFGRGFERGREWERGQSSGREWESVWCGGRGPAKWLDKSQCSAYALGAAH